VCCTSLGVRGGGGGSVASGDTIFERWHPKAIEMFYWTCMKSNVKALIYNKVHRQKMRKLRKNIWIKVTPKFFRTAWRGSLWRHWLCAIKKLYLLLKNIKMLRVTSVQELILKWMSWNINLVVFNTLSSIVCLEIRLLLLYVVFLVVVTCLND